MLSDIDEIKCLLEFDDYQLEQWQKQRKFEQYNKITTKELRKVIMILKEWRFDYRIKGFMKLAILKRLEQLKYLEG